LRVRCSLRTHRRSRSERAAHSTRLVASLHRVAWLQPSGASTSALVGNRAFSRFEVTLREGAARARLQVPLETDGPRLIRELDYDVHPPRSAGHRMGAASRVVVRQPSVHIGREADVEVSRLIGVSQNVNKAPRSGHGAANGNQHSWTRRIEVGRQSLPRLETSKISASVWRLESGNLHVHRRRTVAHVRGFAATARACRTEFRSQALTSPPSRRFATPRRGILRV
jgi:hypothetical protein